MFTMTLRWDEDEPIAEGGRRTIAEGERQPGEDWKDCVLRLFRQVKDDGVKRCVYLMPADDDEAEGERSVHLVREAGHPMGLAHAVEQLRVETDPPQFAPPRAEGSSRIL